MVLGATTPAIATLSPPSPIFGPSSTRFNGLHGRFSPYSSPPRYLRPSIRHKGLGFGRNRLRSTISATVSSEVGSVTAESNPPLSLEVSEIKKMCSEWKWRGYSINYLVVHGSDGEEEAGSLRPPPVLLVHGFGASIAHWRRNILTLAQTRTVYAIDLLGFGASDKPEGFAYTMETWAQLILDFLEEVVGRPTVLIGNSVGSLACVIAASESRKALVRGLVLLNCAGGMNNKAIVDDWRIRLLFPLLWLIDFLLNQKVIASFFFERVKRSENLRNILLSVYGNKDSVDDELVQIIKEPADDAGALEAFVSIITGPPGPNPVQLMPTITTLPVLLLWGNNDPFTPLDGPVGKYFSSLPAQLPNVRKFEFSSSVEGETFFSLEGGVMQICKVMANIDSER